MPGHLQTLKFRVSCSQRTQYALVEKGALKRGYSSNPWRKILNSKRAYFLLLRNGLWQGLDSRANCALSQSRLWSLLTVIHYRSPSSPRRAKKQTTLGGLFFGGYRTKMQLNESRRRGVCNPQLVAVWNQTVALYERMSVNQSTHNFKPISKKQ